MGAGTAFSAYSSYQSAQAQADAEQANAAYYQKQAEYSKISTDRELDIYNNEVDDLLGRQQNAFSKAGVSLSGSPLLLLGQTRERADKEIAAIKEKGRQNVELTLMRAYSSDATAGEIRSGAPWQAAGTLASGAGQIMSRANTNQGGNVPTATNHYYY